MLCRTSTFGSSPLSTSQPPPPPPSKDSRNWSGVWLRVITEGFPRTLLSSISLSLEAHAHSVNRPAFSPATGDRKMDGEKGVLIYDSVFRFQESFFYSSKSQIRPTTKTNEGQLKRRYKNIRNDSRHL